MGPWRTISVALRADAGQYVAGMSGASAATAKFGATNEAVTTKAGSRWATFAKVAGVGILAVGAALGMAIKQAVEFDTSMRNVNSIMQLSDGAFDSIRSQVVEMSKEMPQSATTLSDGLYNIASAGFMGAEGIEVLRISAESATAGLTDTETAAKGVTAVLNAYGLEASDADSVSNALFQTVKSGVITFEELSNSIGTFAPAAAAAGISIQDASAALAAMTLSGLNAARASTALNRLITSFIDPSDDFVLALEAMGYESGLAAIEAEGLEGAMLKVNEATGGNVSELQKLFPEQRAFLGALALGAADGENYARVMRDMANADRDGGARKAALAEQMKAVSVQWALFQSTISAAAITVGTKMLPALGALTGAADSGFTALADGVVDVAGKLEPFGRSLMSTAENVGAILAQAWEAGEPFVVGMGKLAGGLVIGGLILVAGALEKITGFIASSEVAVVGLTSALIAMAAVKTFTVLAGAVETFYLKTLYAQDRIVAGNARVGGSFGLLRAAISSPTLAVAALAAAGIVAYKGFQQAAEQARAEIDNLAESMNVQWDNANSIGRYRDELIKLRDEAIETNDANTGLGSGFRFVAEMVTPMENSVLDARVAVREYNDAISEAREKSWELIDRVNDTRDAYQDLSGTTDHSSEAVRGWIASLEAEGIDTTTMSAEELAEAIHEVRTAAAADTDFDEYTEALRILGDQFADTEEQVDAFKDAIDIALGQPIDIRATMAAYYDSLDSLKARLFEVGRTGSGAFDLTTEKGREMSAVFEETVDKSRDMAEAMYNKGDAAGARAALMDTRDGILEVAETFGIPIEEVERFLAEVGLDPHAIDLLFSTHGTEDVDAALAELEQDRVVTLTIRESDQKLEELQAAIEELGEGHAVEMILGLDREPFDNELDVLVDWISTVDPELAVQLDTMQPEEKYLLLQQLAGQWRSTETEGKALLDYGPAELGFDSLFDMSAWYDSLTPEARATLDRHAANGDFQALHEAAQRWREANPRTTAEVDTATAQAQIDRFLRQPRSIQIRANFLTENLDLYARQGSTGGRRWGGIDSYAKGGIRAHVGKGDLIRYAEPETEQEAYIPKRGDEARSLGILDEVAGWFNKVVVDPKALTGFAFGGITGGGMDAGTPPNLTDLDATALAEWAAEVHATFDELNVTIDEWALQSAATVDDWAARTLDAVTAYSTAVQAPLAASSAATLAGHQAWSDQWRMITAGWAADSEARVATFTGNVTMTLATAGNTWVFGVSDSANRLVTALTTRLDTGATEVGGIVGGYARRLADGINPLLAAIGEKTVKFAKGGEVLAFADGGQVPLNMGIRGKDSILAAVTPGEFVLTPEATQRAGVDNLKAFNEGRTQGIQGFAKGGVVGKTGDPRIDNLNPLFLAAFNAYNASIGNPLTITSGWRSTEHQARLFAANPNPRMVARPGSSNHERGLAIDHAPHSTAAWRAAAGGHGLRYPMGWEPWHVEPGNAGAMAAGFNMDLPAPPGIDRMGLFADAGRASMKHMYDKTSDWMLELMTASFTDGGDPASTEMAGEWIRQAMALTGVPDSWFTGLMTIARRESNFNPRAINNWDINAKRGIPSKGLMQTIGPTFDTHALPGMNDIFNPVHNAAAAIRYILSRYGDISKVQQANPAAKPRGYADGGLVFDQGGVLAPGRNTVWNNTGADEHLIPTNRIPKAPAPVVHVHVDGANTGGELVAQKIGTQIIHDPTDATVLVQQLGVMIKGARG